MIARIIALVVIFLCSSVAWMILGANVHRRTYSSDRTLREKVASTWGSAHQQKPPRAYFLSASPVPQAPGSLVYDYLLLDASKVAVDLRLEHRRKGLLWYSTYTVAFEGNFTFRNHGSTDAAATFELPLPTAKAVFDGLALSVNGASVDVVVDGARATGTASVPAGGTAVFTAKYKSQGLDRWQYVFGESVAGVRDFQLKMTTNFHDIDFPDDTLSPTAKHGTGSGWELHWKYHNLVSGVTIAMNMPQRLQPGQLAGDICYFAPVSLLFFFFVLFMVTTLRGIDLHPVNYFFLAAAFFAFHLLLAYLVDHVSIHWAFLISSLVSLFLVASYLRLVVGRKFALREAGIAQFLYLVLFSYAFFFEGFTGLTVTLGAIVTLFVVMQATARIRWSERFSTSN